MKGTTNKIISEAVEEAVRDAGFGDKVGTKLVHWLTALTSGSEGQHYEEEALQHLDLIFDDLPTKSVEKE